MTQLAPPETAIQIIEQASGDLLEGIVTTPEKTIGSIAYEITLNIPPMASLIDVPASFIEGLKDCAEGRTVDMDVAMFQLHPDRAI
jgi:hypothetical protein